MFNAEQKERFLAETDLPESKQKVYRAIFESIAKYEEEWNADFCTLDTDKTQIVLDNTAGFRKRSFIVTLSMFRKYVSWCDQNMVSDVSQSIFEIEDSGLDKLKNRMVANPMHLQRYLDALCEPEEMKTISNVYRCFYWLAYAGVPDDIALKLDTSDVDFVKRVVRYDFKEYPIYEQAVPAFENCINLSAFVRNNPNYNSDTKVMIERGAGSNLLRGSNETTALQTIKVEFSKMSKRAINSGKTTMKLSYNRVMLSGMYFRMYERERAGLNQRGIGIAVILTRREHYRHAQQHQ